MTEEQLKILEDLRDSYLGMSKSRYLSTKKCVAAADTLTAAISELRQWQKLEQRVENLVFSQCVLTRVDEARWTASDLSLKTIVTGHSLVDAFKNLPLEAFAKVKEQTKDDE